MYNLGGSFEHAHPHGFSLSYFGSKVACGKTRTGLVKRGLDSISKTRTGPAIIWLIPFIFPALPYLTSNPSSTLSCFTGALSFLSSAHSFHVRSAQAVLCLVFNGIRLSFLFPNSSSLISGIFLLFVDSA